MILSEVNDYSFTDYEIQNIVYGDIEDNGQNAKYGFTDSDNWYLSEEGRKICKSEVRNMVVQAKRDQMIDLNIQLKKKHKNSS